MCLESNDPKEWISYGFTIFQQKPRTCQLNLLQVCNVDAASKSSVRNRKSCSSLPDQKKLARIEGQPNLCLVTATAHHSIFNPSTAQQCYSVIQGQQSELPSTTVAASLWRSISMRVSPFLTKRSATNLWELMGSNNRCLLDLRDLIGFTVIKGIYSN